MMKQIILFLLLLVSPLMAQKFMFFEAENRYSFSSGKTDVRPEVNIYAQAFPEKGKIGGYFYGLVNDSWGEAYGGIIVKPSDIMTVNLGIGVENDPDPYRINLGSYLQTGNFWLFQWYEYGGSGFWYDVTVNYKLMKEFSAGVIYKRYYGLGLNLWFYIPDSFLSFNVAPLYDLEFDTPGLMAIARFSF